MTMRIQFFSFDILRFPEMGVAPVTIHLYRIFHEINNQLLGIIRFSASLWFGPWNNVVTWSPLNADFFLAPKSSHRLRLSERCKRMEKYGNV